MDTLNKAVGRSSRGKLRALIAVGMILAGCNYVPPSEDRITETLVKPTVTETMPAIKTAVVDKTPWVELTPMVTETAEPTATETAEPTPTVEATSVVISKKYPVKWSEGYTANVGGMEIPIDIGLTHWVMNRPEQPITEIHIAEDMVDKVGEYFMHMCFWRYTQLMDHPDVTYGQYLELMAKGEGKIEVPTYDEDRLDQKESEMNIIDPRKGFSYSMVDGKLPMNSGDASFFLGNSKEKILLSSYVPSYYLINAKNCNYSKQVCVNLLFGYKIIGTLGRIGYINNDNNNSSVPSQFIDWQNLGVRKEMDNYLYGSRTDPPFLTFQD